MNNLYNMMNSIDSQLKEILNLLLQNRERINYGLFSGRAGSSLLLLLSSSCMFDNIYYNKGIEEVESIFEEIKTSEVYDLSLCNGLAGIGWFLNFIVDNELIELDINKSLSEIDDILFLEMKKTLSLNNWDFLHGALGIGLYFIIRCRHLNLFQENLEYLMRYFENNTIKEDEKCFKWKSKLNNEGYNISLSHGISSIAALMTKMYKENIFPERAKRIAEGAIEYILRQEIDVNIYGSYFPNYSKEYNSGIITKSRLGWCYGDLGVSIVLLNAGKAFKKEAWENKAIEVLLYAARERKKLNSNMIFDAGLCHGVASVAHIFYRAWWITQIQEFKDASKYWHEQLLLMTTVKESLVEYKPFSFMECKREFDYGLLEGVTGIGLVMFSYITNTEPTWDECLLLS